MINFNNGNRLEFNKLSRHFGIWTEATGPYSDLIMTSRVRLARNLKNYPFTSRASKQEQEQVLEQILNVCQHHPKLQNATAIKMSSLNPIERHFLLERHLISSELVNANNESALIFDEQEEISIMLNEEDHLRLQVITSGFQPRLAWEIINQLDDELSGELDYAFSENWGYLTACPTNTGTGIRISVLMHLPALVLTKKITQIINGISQIGLNVRGLYGEGTDVMGNIFQISNQTTLGRSEIELLENIERIAKQIMDYEREARELFIKDAHLQIEDKIWRAYSILRYARMMASNEFLSLSSAVRLGVSLNILNTMNLKQINELMLLTQPSHIQKYWDAEMNHYERDEMRAKLIRERLEE